MASQHVEVEAAKLLHKLIQESKDEPTKLAMKLYVICQHMRSSGKEQSLPYQVILRAMETVVSQHGLDIDVLRSSRIQLSGGPQRGHFADVKSIDKETSDSKLPIGATGMPYQGFEGSSWRAASSSQSKECSYAGSFQNYGMQNDSNATSYAAGMTRQDLIKTNRPPMVLSRRDSMGADVHHGSMSQSSKSFEHESSASIRTEDTVSANSEEKPDAANSDKQTKKKVTKKAAAKRKRADFSDNHSDNLRQLDTLDNGVNSRKAKQMNRAGTQDQFAIDSSAHVQVNSASGKLENLSSLDGSLVPFSRSKQEAVQVYSERTMEKTKSSKSFSLTPLLKLPEEGEVSSSNNVIGIQKRGLAPPRSNISPSTCVRDQKVSLPTEDTQRSISGHIGPFLGINNEAMCPANEEKRSTQEFGITRSQPSSLPAIHSQSTGKVSVGISGAFSSFAMTKMGFSAPVNNSDSSYFETSSGSQFSEKGKDLDGNNPCSQFPLHVYAKAPANSENRDCSITRDGMIRFPGKALENLSETSMACISPGKTILQERVALHTGDVCTVPQGNGIREQQNKGNFLVKAEVVRQMNKEFFVKPNSNAKLFGELNNNTEINTLSYSAPKDIRTAFVPQSSASSNMPFKEQHLKQLRAQCLVFLAFKNNLMPRKLHLEIALGGIYPKDGTSNMPFKEQHLIQLRAQCLVFLAFKNNLMPRKLHLEIALGGIYPKDEEICKELDDSRGDASKKEPANSHENSSMFGRSKKMIQTSLASSPTGSMESDSSKDPENTKKHNKLPVSDRSVMPEGIKQLPIYKQKYDSEMRSQKAAESHAGTVVQHENDSRPLVCKQEGAEYSTQQGTGVSHVSSVLSAKKGANLLGSCMNMNIVSNSHSTKSVRQQGQKLERVGTSLDRSQTIGESGDLVSEANSKEDDYQSTVNEKNSQNIEAKSFNYVMNPLKDVNLPFINIGMKDKLFAGVITDNTTETYAGRSESNVAPKNDKQKFGCSDGLNTLIADNGFRHDNMLQNSAEREDKNIPTSDATPASPPKYTLSEKWIMDQQEKKITEEQKWMLKQKKAEERINTRFNKLKENVNSSEDISAKTRSVIELKKLQLLHLQRRLRSDFLNDFFKPITTDMERLKSIKKHRQGRQTKQIKKVEQRMKEERQRRIRERQKDFFGEIDIHREKLEDCLKVRRERWKGFNKYVKEFHKRKERIHREKIDRIQRQKINLLKNNDVEGYLRMVQDAKSDRVKQLLKETEKYLQKLASKLQGAKSMSKHFEMEMDDDCALNVVETNGFAIENGDESDQAEHYLESNEKYYMMAHSVKESINEQPTSLQGGKLREYQMNGLRWLVSLYNNHLNGILADEMGLGKTVQVIALICYLMETKNDRGPFLVVVPSSVRPGWEAEIGFWAPGINKISYFGPPEERRRLFKERIVPQKFNVLLTTYEYLMNRHDRPKLSKIHWHYVIIDEGHRIKNASCKLNADLKHYKSSHRLLLTGTPLQNNLEELWALLNFLLPDIFNSSEDFSQWFNKPFDGSVDNSPDETLLSEEENLLIINRLHQVLRPFVLRRLKHKVENELPEKIERLVRCEASAYQKLLMKRVEENLGSIRNSKGHTIHNSVMELRNICNHPYLSHLHVEEVDSLIPKHHLPPVVRLCGKLEMLDRLLPKLRATGHRVLFFSTMTKLLDVMEEYLSWKCYRYLRLDGRTSGGERGSLIEQFNRPGSEFFIFLLSIRAGGVGVNLQAADTVIIFDTDWNPQVDLQAQARAHRIGQKKDVLVLRLETVHTVEEQVRASAEHKLGVANQSITAGFFDNNTSAEDRKEYLESLLRECKKEEASPVLDDDALNDLLARSESEIDVFEAVDKQRREEEMATWKRLVQGNSVVSKPFPIPSRIVTEDDLKPFYQAMKIHETHNVGVKCKGEHLGDPDTQQYGRGKRARQVQSYEEQSSEEEFERLCQVGSSESPHYPQPTEMSYSSSPRISNSELQLPKNSSAQFKVVVGPCKVAQHQETRRRGRPKRAVVDNSQPSVVPILFNIVSAIAAPDSVPSKDPSGTTEHDIAGTAAPLTSPAPAVLLQVKGQKAQKAHNGEAPRGCGRKHKSLSSSDIMKANDIGPLEVTNKASNKSEDSLVPDRMKTSRNSDIPGSLTVGDGASKIRESLKEDDLSIRRSMHSPFSEKLKHNLPAMDINRIGKVVSSEEIKPPSISGSIYFLQPSTHTGTEPGVLQVDPEHISGPSIPDIPVLMNESKENRTRDMSSSICTNRQNPAEDRDGTAHCRENEVSTVCSKLYENQEATAKQNDTSLSNSETTHPISDSKSSEEQNPADKKVYASFCSTQFSGDNVDVSSSQSNLIAVSRQDGCKVSPLSGIGGKTTFNANLGLKSVEEINCQESVNFDKARALTHENAKNETLLSGPSGQARCPRSKERRTVAAVVRRGPENKASVTRRKVSACEPRNRSSSTTAACERRARLAGLKLGEEKKVDRKRKTVQSVTINDRRKTDCIRPVSVTSELICNSEDNIKFQAHTTPSFHLGNPIEKTEFCNRHLRKLDLSTAEEISFIQICEVPATLKSEENRSTGVDRPSKNTPVIEPSPLHLNELQLNAIQLSRTNIGGVIVNDTPLRKADLAESCSSDSKSGNCIPCSMEIPIETIDKHHSLEHLKSRTSFSGEEESQECATIDKPTCTPEGNTLLQSCRENMHRSCEKNCELNSTRTKAKVLEVGSTAELNSKELICLQGNELALSVGVEINEKGLEGSEGRLHDNFDAAKANKDSRLITEIDLSKECCIIPSSFELVNLHENAVSVSDGKEVANCYCPDNPETLADGDNSCKKVIDSDTPTIRISVSKEVIKDARESKGETHSFMGSSALLGFNVNSNYDRTLSTSEERKPADLTMIDNPTLKIGAIPSFTANMIEGISRSDNLSLGTPQADIECNVTHSLAKSSMGSVLNSFRQTVNLPGISSIEDVSHGVATASDPLLGAAFEMSTPEIEVKKSRVTVVLSTEVPINEHARNSSFAILEEPEKSGRQYSDIDTASGAKVIGHSTLNCQSPASPPRGSVCRTTECSGGNQENLPVIDELTESPSDGAVKVADSSLLTCQELATSTSDQSISGITGVCLDKELLNPSITGKDPACMVTDQVEEVDIRKENSGCTSSLLNFGLFVQSSSNLVEAEPVRTLDMVVSAPENAQAVSSLFNSKPLPKASGKPLIVEVSNLDNVGERETPQN